MRSSVLMTVSALALGILTAPSLAQTTSADGNSAAEGSTVNQTLNTNTTNDTNSSTTSADNSSTNDSNNSATTTTDNTSNTDNSNNSTNTADNSNSSTNDSNNTATTTTDNTSNTDNSNNSTNTADNSNSSTNDSNNDSSNHSVASSHNTTNTDNSDHSDNSDNSDNSDHSRHVAASGSAPQTDGEQSLTPSFGDSAVVSVSLMKATSTGNAVAYGEGSSSGGVSLGDGSFGSFAGVMATNFNSGANASQQASVSIAATMGDVNIGQ